MPDSADTDKYRVSHASRDDMNEGWVWVLNKELKNKIEGKRRIVRIKKIPHKQCESEAADEKESQAVYCEALYADEIFLARYKRYCNENEIPAEGGEGDGTHASKSSGDSERNSKSEDSENRIFISAWYRYLLGIHQKEPGKDPRRHLQITVPKNSWVAVWWQFWACVKHPQIVVALGTALGLIGFFLGIAGIGLGLVSVKDVEHWGQFAVWVGRFGVFILLPLSVLGLSTALIPFYLRAKRGIVSRDSKSGVARSS